LSIERRFGDVRRTGRGVYFPIILFTTPNVTAATTKPEHGKARPAKGSNMERGQSV
jgi:hypothetical protein